MSEDLDVVETLDAVFGVGAVTVIDEPAAIVSRFTVEIESDHAVSVEEAADYLGGRWTLSRARDDDFEELEAVLTIREASVVAGQQDGAPSW